MKSFVVYHSPADGILLPAEVAFRNATLTDVTSSVEGWRRSTLPGQLSVSLGTAKEPTNLSTGNSDAMFSATSTMSSVPFTVIADTNEFVDRVWPKEI